MYRSRISFALIESRGESALNTFIVSTSDTKYDDNIICAILLMIKNKNNVKNNINNSNEYRKP